MPFYQLQLGIVFFIINRGYTIILKQVKDIYGTRHSFFEENKIKIVKKSMSQQMLAAISGSPSVVCTLQ